MPQIGSVQHLESTVKAIEACTTADEVFSALNRFLSLERTRVAIWLAPAPMRISSSKDIYAWLRELKAVSIKGSQLTNDITLLLPELYCVMRVASRKIDAIGGNR